ncbi:MAG: GGDEF domain-containing protein, partial [Burkholderiaceae bacterium]
MHCMSVLSSIFRFHTVLNSFKRNAVPRAAEVVMQIRCFLKRSFQIGLKAFRIFLGTFALFVFSAQFSGALAQLNEMRAPLIQNYDAKIYKAHSQNWAALQDQRGVMYFGNSQGILEFDGQHWRSLATTGNPMVRSLHMASDGTIFYGAIGDFGYLEASLQGKLTAKSIKEMLPQEERVSNDVWQIASTSQGVYFLTRSRIFHLNAGKLSSLAGKFAPSQAVVLNDHLFYVDSERGICVLDGDQIVPIAQLSSLLSGRRIVMTVAGEHQILIGRTIGDFKLVDFARQWDAKQKRYLFDAATAPNISSFPTEIDHILDEDHAYMYKLISLSDDQFAISSVRAGVMIFNRQGQLRRVINKNSGLQDNTVAGITQDRDGNLWAATNSGISHVELAVPQSQFGARNGLEGISISAANYQGRMYVGGFQNTYVKMPFKFELNHDVPRFQAIEGGLSEVWQFLEVSGDLLAASGRGLYRVSEMKADKVPNSSGNAYCLGVSPSWPDHVFVGLMGGVEVFKKHGGAWVLQGRLQGVKENIRRISTDARGDLWLNTEVGGLLRVHFNSEKVTDISTSRIGIEHGMPELIASRTSVLDGQLYLSTPKGLYIAQIAEWSGDKDKTRFVPETRFGKQFADGSIEVNEIVRYDSKSFLMKSSKGIFLITKDGQGNFLADSQAFSGLPMPDDTLFVDSQAAVWLTGEVLYRVDPRALQKRSVRFDTYISGVHGKAKQQVFDGVFAKAGHFFGKALTVSQLAQNSDNRPSLKYEENELVFDFASSHYAKAGSTRFQYFLQGFDKDWSAADLLYSKEYTNLPEGDYQFRVRAENLNGELAREAVYGFRILAPWYRTWWAYCLWTILSLGAIVASFRFYTLHLRREKQHLEELVEQRTRELRDATLTDPLTGLRNRRFISEVLHNDVAAFVGYKNYVLSAENARDGMTGKEVFGLFLMDMDHFKQVNDTYGHDAGDHVLRQFAEILTQLVRQDDVVVRLGGEEFLVVLKKTKPNYVHVFASKVLEAVAAKKFDLGDGQLIHKTCSI